MRGIIIRYVKYPDMRNDEELKPVLVNKYEIINR